jgi:RNA polymerase sigma-70 factor, ECF subfamily
MSAASTTPADEATYRRLVEPHRSELHAHCYRMLGSVHEAEDALQDAMLRAWKALPRFQDRGTVRAWLYKIATNTCLDAIARRPKRVLPIDHAPASDAHAGVGEPVVESVWIEPYPDERLGVEDGYAAPEARYERREGMELAFIAALQHLPANQRAVLITREVLGFSAQETADLLETSVQSVNSALQRARKTVDEKLPAQSQQATLRALGDERLRAIVDEYVAAWERSDVDAVVAMLAEDATLAMPPMPTWYAGREAVAGFLRRMPLSQELRWRVLPAPASGQVGLGYYLYSEESGTFLPHGVNVLTLHGARIAEIIAFLTPETFGRFGLPAEIQP